MKALGAPMGRSLGAFDALGSRPARSGTLPLSAGSRQKLPRNPNYTKVKVQFEKAVASMPSEQQAQIPATGTLPERMVAYALVKLSMFFECQSAHTGGRLRLGGAIVDMIVYFGTAKVAVRVNGTYWHTMPERKQKDEVQLMRLRAKRIRVWDAWDLELYHAWGEGRLVTFVEEGLKNAA
jgi:hypothetical protein